MMENVRRLAIAGTLALGGAALLLALMAGASTPVASAAAMAAGPAGAAVAVLTAAPVTGSIGISPTTSDVLPGSEFTTSIAISTGVALRGAEFGLLFDPAVLQCEAVSEGTFFSNWASSNAASTFFEPGGCVNATGTLSPTAVSLILGGTAGPTGGGELAAVRFKALLAGSSPLTLTQTTASVYDPVKDTSVSHAIAGDNGTVVVESQIFLPLVTQ